MTREDNLNEDKALLIAFIVVNSSAANYMIQLSGHDMFYRGGSVVINEATD